jgi:hypothetical protein
MRRAFHCERWGVSREQVLADMHRLSAAAGGKRQAAALCEVPAPTFMNVMSGTYNPGETILLALYGPSGSTLRPKLLAFATGKGPSPEAAVAAADEPRVLAPICGEDAFGGLTVAELLRRGQRKAAAMESDLDELTGALASLLDLATALAGEEE